MEPSDNSAVCQKLREALPESPERHLRSFLREILVYMDAMRNRVTRRPTNKEMLYEIDRTKNKVGKWIETLDELITFKYYLSDVYGGIYDLAKIRMGKADDNLLAASGKSLLALQHVSMKAKQELLEILNCLEEFRQEVPPRKAGRASADEDGFVAAIALAYKEFIGTPTGYDEGPFVSVVRIALEEVGLPCADPSRKIIAALASLDETGK